MAFAMATRGRKKKMFVEEEILLPAYIDVVCSFCSAEFLELDDLKIHLKQVHVTSENRRRFCEPCSMLYPDMELFLLHLRDEHMSGMQCCKYCTRIFLDYEQFKKHEYKHYFKVSKSMYACSHCHVLFDNIIELEQHEFDKHKESGEGMLLQDYFPLLSSILNIKAITFLQNYSEEMVYTCAQCKYISQNLMDHITHLKRMNCRSFACDNCSRVYNTKHSLSKHIIEHAECRNNLSSQNYMKKCLVCNKFFDPSTFNRHQQKCKLHNCSVCKLQFNTIQEMSVHQSSEHPLAVSLVHCKFCQKEYVGNVALEKHIERTHKNEKELYKYSCSYCDNSVIFKHPQRLFTHFYSVHKSLEPYTCKICNIKFKIRKKFTLHIKMIHKSVGFVEYDEKYNVFFTSEKTVKSPITNIGTCDNNHEISQSEVETRQEQEESVPENNESMSENVGVDKTPNIEEKIGTEINPSETDRVRSETNVQEKKKKILIKRASKSKRNATSESENEIYTESLSSGDEPLLEVRKKKRRLRHKATMVLRNNNAYKRKLDVNDKQKRFVCNICRKSSKTLQEYHQHLGKHFKQNPKKCYKCSMTFESIHEFNNHLATEHKTSQITSTLRTLLEKRLGRPSNVIRELSNSEKFAKTIKKVEFDPSQNVRVTVTEVPKDKLSVQNYIENFTPDTGEKKKGLEIQCNVSVKTVTNPEPKKPLIKMVKLTPFADNDFKPNLSMPIPFKRGPETNCKVSVKVVQSETPQTHHINDSTYSDNETDDDKVYLEHDFINDEDRADDIPEVAEEVMLEGTEEIKVSGKGNSIQRNIEIPDIPHVLKKVKIAHLVPEAPYYKIVKMTDVLGNINEKKNESERESNHVSLPSGLKLVSVNPLAHLLGDKQHEIEPLKKQYYKPKRKNYLQCVTEGLLKLSQQPLAKKKKTSSQSN